MPDLDHDPKPANVDSKLGSLGAKLNGWMFRGSILAFAGRILFGVSVILQNAVLARLFRPDELGFYILLQSLLLPAQLIAVFGTDLLIVRSIGELRARDEIDRVRKTIRDSTLVVCIMSLAGAALLALAFSGACTLGWIPCETVSKLHILVGPLVLLSALQLLSAGVFRGFGWVGLATLFSGVLSNLSLLVCLTVVYYVPVDVRLADVVLLQICSLALALVFAAGMLRNRLPAGGTRSRLAVKPLLATGMALMATQLLAIIVTQSDVWVVSAIASPEYVASYGLASRLAQLVSLPHLVLNSVLPPLIAILMPSGEHRRLERMAQMSVSVAALAALSCFVIFLTAGRDLLGLLFGAAYEDAWRYLIILSLGNVVNVAAGACSQMLIITGHQNTLLRITLGSSAFCIVAALVGAQFWGVTGVAIAYAAGLSLQGFVSAYAAMRSSGIRSYVSPTALLDAVQYRLRPPEKTVES
jgi:O-antigen/teichoic acid export membrane protein